MKRLLMTVAAVGALAGFALAVTASAQQVVITLDELNASGITGSATLTPSADGSETTVEVTASGLDPNTTHLNHIHDGTCATYGGVVATLTGLAADGNGDATAQTTVSETDMAEPLTFADIADGNHVVIVHDQQGVPAACGAIPVAQAPTATATATTAPQATATAGPSLPGTGASGDGSATPMWMIAGLLGAGAAAAAGFAALRVRAR